MVRTHFQHPGKQLLFALLSLTDLALTWLLLRHSSGTFYEANPVADWWLQRHGWLGVTCFKGTTVLVVLVLAGHIGRSRPKTGARVLCLGCVCLAAVIAYSGALYGGVWPGDVDPDAEMAAHMERTNREVQALHCRQGPFRLLLTELSQATLEGRCSLQEVEQRLAATEEARNPYRLRCLANQWPQVPPHGRLACTVVSRVIVSVRDPLACRSIFRRLDGEFRSTFGVPLPPMVDPNDPDPFADSLTRIAPP